MFECLEQVNPPSPGVDALSPLVDPLLEWDQLGPFDTEDLPDFDLKGDEISLTYAGES
ncbi:hypothetical protein F2Q70_00008139 [Brassica cretica]|uniref:Uncharacterized protein n=1 Tax=Brassica cretica TaxID=69181 RepID=A0A8S9M6E1_BRACR|nr:hypothetical protein F2Q68_00001168 [Brassica cretica]KAF2615630.1 hypothetical protein F2Q70_00008139 [Brassica cretica]